MVISKPNPKMTNNIHPRQMFQIVFVIVWMDALIGSTIEPLRNLGHRESCCKKDLVRGTTLQYATYKLLAH